MQAQLSDPSPPKHVLLVDPEVEFRERLISPFETFGYRINAASDGEEALAAFDAETPHAVITEVSLPRFDGFELARRIRSRPLGGYPSIVAVTRTQITALREEEALRAGCDLLLDKPSHPWSFATRVDILIRQSRELRLLSKEAIVRADRVGEKAADVRARAKDVVERSMDLRARSSVLTLANRILRDLLPAPGIAIDVAYAARMLDVDEADARRALDELVRLKLLKKTTDSSYSRHR